MKRKYCLIAIIALCCGIIAIHIAVRNHDKVHISEPVSCILTNHTGDENISVFLPDSDAKEIAELINGRHFYRDSPACGFSERASFSISSESTSYTFYAASDGCPILYAPDKGKYVKLTENEAAILHEILGSYGLTFPCV